MAALYLGRPSATSRLAPSKTVTCLALRSVAPEARRCFGRSQASSSKIRGASQDVHFQPPRRPLKDGTSLGSVLRAGGWRRAARERPLAFGVSVSVVLALFGCVGAAVYIYRLYYSVDMKRFPEPVAQELRRALHHTMIVPDPKEAVKHYNRALALCSELGLDPFADEVLGIRIHIAEWLESLGLCAKAAEVLESVLADLSRWIDAMDRSVADGTMEDKLAPLAAYRAAVADPSVNTDDILETENELRARLVREAWEKRSRLLKKAVGTSLKLGDLYSDVRVLDYDKAHEKLMWAAETNMREMQRRRTKGVKDGEGDFTTPEEFGASLEALAHSYEARSNFDLAVPLFLHALRLCADPCHRAVLMNNLSAALAQHPLIMPLQPSLTGAAGSGVAGSSASSEAGRPTRDFFIDAGKNWANAAFQHAQQVQGSQRTTECDEACAVALCNLGDMASISCDAASARKHFEDALKLSKRIGFVPGIAQAEGGLAALRKQSNS